MIKLPFRDRREAGRLLATELTRHKFNFVENMIVLGLPRGGVVVGSVLRMLYESRPM